MLDTRMIIACALAAGMAAVAIAVLSPLAVRVGLVDRPNKRKLHVGNIPLIGGLAAFIGVLVGAFYYEQFVPFTYVLLATAAAITVLGAIDDRFDLSVSIRLLVQTIAVLAVIASTGIYIHTLGHLFGRDVTLGWAGIPLTVIAVIGLLNAFNMMDGIDGLAGSLTLVSIAAIFLFTGRTSLPGAMVLIGLLGAALLPYLACNVGFMGRKIFLGDAGSMLIGYVLAWTLIRLSQEPGTHLSPVDVLWCVALPALDTIAVMYRRLRQGKSPFKPDRGHIHHILMGMGLSQRATLVALIALAASIAFLGNVAHSLGAGPGSNLVAFCLFAGLYIITVTRIWGRQKAREAILVIEATSQAAPVSNVLSMVGKRAAQAQTAQKATQQVDAREGSGAAD
ncbi:MAG: undecaprenyl/decaprenyl-phosphate alpha-N-acetylglucosaminyl 1-phosphate transferase [Rhodanobacter sp.]